MVLSLIFWSFRFGVQGLGFRVRSMRIEVLDFLVLGSGFRAVSGLRNCWKVVQYWPLQATNIYTLYPTT
jgi:hypothetical protein